ncbi:hypothetical protein GWC95_09795 [Sediminibacterium roseum]|uniref:AhpC/TSA family protein n=1 Tax=Sediminibacterium roseum TaxID=1978412 RepID=A0ABW9ZSX2_9BACT|nr:hypothetical protein [Sediminibacterium roseum]NCI50216.1 hypothetical protein [Sediminibacterium roseum]
MKKLQPIFIATLLVLDLLMGYRVFTANKRQKELVYLLGSKNELVQVEKERSHKLKDNAIAQHRIEATSLPKESLGLYRDSLPALVLRMHVNNCNDCVKKAIERLEQIADNKQLKVIVLANFETIQSLLASYPTKLPVILAKSIPQDSISSTKPYLFITRRSGETEHVFFPEWDMPELIDGYIQMVRRTYLID